MDFVLQIIERMIWPGLAAVGFAILFNVPQRTLIVIFGMEELLCKTRLRWFGHVKRREEEHILRPPRGGKTIGYLRK